MVIGRNEGERLRTCLRALSPLGIPAVYVDSGSSDGSCETASSIGANVVELDTSVPFTAARARNAGVKQFLSQDCPPKYVQFLDGDCELMDGWIEQARDHLESAEEIVAVCGRRRERFPGASIYNLIIDLEWDTPCGPTLSFGGDAMVRLSALESVGAFDESVAAGEEPELCDRLRKRGGSIERIDVEMTLHDADISSFSQWWKRHLRSGYGGLDVRRRKGVAVFDRELESSRRWTVCWLSLSLVLACILGWQLGWEGLAIGCLLGITAWFAQTFRLARYYHRHKFSWFDAARAAVISMIVKWANLAGQIRYLLDSRSGRVSRMIEYKRKQQPPIASGFLR